MDTKLDAKVIIRVAPITVERYLKARNWRRLIRFSGRVSRWFPLHGGGRPIVDVPLNRGFADYALRIGEVIATVSESETRHTSVVREPQAILDELLHAQLRTNLLLVFYYQVTSLMPLCSEAREPVMSDEALAENRKAVANTLDSIDDTLAALDELRISGADVLESILTNLAQPVDSLEGLRSNAEVLTYKRTFETLYKEAREVFVSYYEDGKAIV